MDAPAARERGLPSAGARRRTTHDAAHRAHSLRLSLPSDFPMTAPKCEVDAPDALQLQGVAPTVANAVQRTLRAILTQFEGFLQTYQGFWNELDAIDAACVLEPQHPSRATGRRRIAVRKHVSSQLELSPPGRARCIPARSATCGSSGTRHWWRLGASDGVTTSSDGPRRPQCWRTSRCCWMLEIQLPSPKTTPTDEFAVECGICYSYRLASADNEANDDGDGAIPDRLCENERCNRPFHESCLFAWLKALPTARQSFNTVFGECPYCRDAISAKFIA